MLTLALKALDQTNTLNSNKLGAVSSTKPYTQTVKAGEIFGCPLDDIRADVEQLAGAPMPQGFVGFEHVRRRAPQSARLLRALSRVLF
jgi:hypothetical protein